MKSVTSFVLLICTYLPGSRDFVPTLWYKYLMLAMLLRLFVSVRLFPCPDWSLNVAVISLNTLTRWEQTSLFQFAYLRPIYTTHTIVILVYENELSTCNSFHCFNDEHWNVTFLCTFIQSHTPYGENHMRLIVSRMDRPLDSLGLLSSYPFFTRTCKHVKVLTLLSSLY